MVGMLVEELLQYQDYNGAHVFEFHNDTGHSVMPSVWCTAR